jgi:hypothetical protein
VYFNHFRFRDAVVLGHVADVRSVFASVESGNLHQPGGNGLPFSQRSLHLPDARRQVGIGDALRVVVDHQRPVRGHHFQNTPGSEAADLTRQAMYPSVGGF